MTLFPTVSRRFLTARGEYIAFILERVSEILPARIRAMFGKGAYGQTALGNGLSTKCILRSRLLKDIDFWRKNRISPLQN